VHKSGDLSKGADGVGGVFEGDAPSGAKKAGEICTAAADQEGVLRCQGPANFLKVWEIIGEIALACACTHVRRRDWRGENHRGFHPRTKIGEPSLVDNRRRNASICGTAASVLGRAFSTKAHCEILPREIALGVHAQDSLAVDTTRDRDGELIIAIIWCIAGRSCVVHEGANAVDGRRLAASVIARSAGVGENHKMVCSCDGTVLWDADAYLTKVPQRSDK